MRFSKPSTRPRARRSCSSPLPAAARSPQNSAAPPISRELLERAARVAQQPVLLALGGQVLELAVDRAQIARRDASSFSLGLRELRERAPV